jgi:two-component system sensor histidine kinase KdpD
MLERDQHLRAQQEAAVLEESRRFQRTLLDHVSHEIKTPVAVIQGCVDHLASGIPSPALLDEIREASDRLDRVMTQLGHLSRAEAGLVQPTYEMTDARDLMAEIAERFAGQEVRLEGGAFTFRTDPSIVGIILFNLLQNALRHGQGKADLAATQTEGCVRFLVSNSGEPIPPGDTARIFDRFQRGDASLGGGMGLGLPIARNFAALLQGNVRLVCSDRKETVFEAAFPS